MASLLLVVVWLYAPTLGFGFFWDDPLWFSRIVASRWASCSSRRRTINFTALAFEGKTALYLFQGFVFPVLGWPFGYEPGQTWAMGMLAALVGLALIRLFATTPQGEPLPQNVFIVSYLP